VIRRPAGRIASKGSNLSTTAFHGQLAGKLAAVPYGLLCRSSRERPRKLTERLGSWPRYWIRFLGQPSVKYSGAGSWGRGIYAKGQGTPKMWARKSVGGVGRRTRKTKINKETKRPGTKKQTGDTHTKSTLRFGGGPDAARELRRRADGNCRLSPIGFFSREQRETVSFSGRDGLL